MNYRFRSKAEVYYVLRNLFAEGGEAPNTEKKLAQIRNWEISINFTHTSLLEHLPLFSQKSSWKIRSKKMPADTTYFFVKQNRPQSFGATIW